MPREVVDIVLRKVSMFIKRKKEKMLSEIYTFLLVNLETFFLQEAPCPAMGVQISWGQ